MKKTEIVLKSLKKKIAVVNKEKHVPSEYFKTRKGLFVWSSFKESILDKAKDTKAGAKFSLASFTLSKRANDEEIEKSLPKKHLFKETNVCAIVANLIEKQSKGEEGVLLNNGYANLFYTSFLVVFVRWDGDEWDVDDWGRGGGAWGGGRRVFAPATDA